MAYYQISIENIAHQSTIIKDSLAVLTLFTPFNIKFYET